MNGAPFRHLRAIRLRVAQQRAPRLVELREGLRRVRDVRGRLRRRLLARQVVARGDALAGRQSTVNHTHEIVRRVPAALLDRPVAGLQRLVAARGE